MSRRYTQKGQKRAEKKRRRDRRLTKKAAYWMRKAFAEPEGIQVPWEIETIAPSVSTLPARCPAVQCLKGCDRC